jgi:hypothetical protein
MLIITFQGSRIRDQPWPERCNPFWIDIAIGTFSMSAHTIRLRGPWTLEPLERFAERSHGGYQPQQASLPRERQQMPADWCEPLGPDFLGIVRYRRNFNRPTNLQDDRVWLLIEPPRSCGLVRVNGSELGYVRFGAPAGRFDITPLLKDHNSIEIDVEHPELDDNSKAPDDGSIYVPGGLVGEVRLEIEDLS